MKTITTTVHLLMLGACLCAASAAMAQAVVTIAEKPLRIIRGGAVYKAAAGTIVQKDDIIETAAGNAQLEAGPDAIIAIGPETRIYIGAEAAEVQLLQGWVKLARASVTMASFRSGFSSGAVIVSSRPGRDALFADEGEQLVVQVDGKGKQGVPVKVPAEQFAFALAGQPLVVQPRAAKDVLGEMPPQFRDRLAPVAASNRVAKVAAVKERAADVADVAPWLASALPARKGLVRRFRPAMTTPSTDYSLEKK